jgi:glutaredoxin 3
MPKIEIYTQNFCGFCARAVRLLTEKGVPFTEIDAPHGSPERQTAITRAGGRTSMPQIFIDGTHIGGCDDLVALNRSGRLDPMLSA